MTLNGGAIIIGSLIWDSKKIRRSWRKEHLVCNRVVRVYLPIRYGRPAKTRRNTYTMVFSKKCYSKNYGLGIGIIAPFKSTIGSFDDLKQEAKSMGKAEGFNDSFSTSWGSLALLTNPNKHINNSYLNEWKILLSKEMTDNSFSYNIVKSESRPINENGFLNIRWPTQINSNHRIDDFDFLIATVTSPILKRNRYPKASEIAKKMVEENYFEYFSKNREFGIITFQDENIFKHLIKMFLTGSLKPLNEFGWIRTELDIPCINSFSSEEAYMALAVKLLKEISQITCYIILNYHFPVKENKNKRERSILLGLIVRISKLQRAIIDQTCQKRREIVVILIRCLGESIVNLNFLLQFNNDIFEEFIISSLTEEKKFLERIERNINTRGYELPIEKRMRSSILKDFKISSLTTDEVDSIKTKSWGTNLYERTRKIGMEDLYFALFGLPSHSVHGNWQDLITHHLHISNGDFFPKIDWCNPRPQQLYTITLLSALTIKNYVNNLFTGMPSKEALIAILNDVIYRIQIADNLHEKFIQKYQS